MFFPAEIMFERNWMPASIPVNQEGLQTY